MLDITCFPHLEFTSNTYLIASQLFPETVHLVDIGNSEEVLNALDPHQKIKSIFLTHAHYDHIYGINEIVEKFPDCIIYCSEYTLEGLRSEKLNLSFYHDHPTIYRGENVEIVKENTSLELYPEFSFLVLETPGHNKGCLSFVFKGGIFTGDSLIPGVPIVTKLKSGHKLDAVKSVHKIQRSCKPTDILYPGHFSICQISDIDWNFYTGT